jgi:hypothetical protein
MLRNSCRYKLKQLFFDEDEYKNVFRRPLCNMAHFTRFFLSENLKLQTISTRTRTNSLSVYNEKFEKSDWPTAVCYIVHGPMINDVYLRATA